MSSLTPAKTINPPAWMGAPETVRVMRVLNADGAGQARFVGGCVRNELLGKPVIDIDIATLWKPQEVMEILKEAGIKAVPTGIDYGTVTAVVDGRGFEITTLRKDIETDGRRAVVAYSIDWREDAARRDFTMNTLLADERGHIYDPLGQGLADLEQRQVVFVGEPAARIAEDYLRILRFFRFHAWYGAGEPDKAALAACRAAAGKIAGLSAERVSQEWFKIVSVDQPVDIIELIFRNNILKEFSYPEYQPELMRRFCDFQNQCEVVSLGGRLFMLAGLQLKNLENLRERLLIPKFFLREIEAIDAVLKLPALQDDHALKVAVYKYGSVAAIQALLIETVQGRIEADIAASAVAAAPLLNIPALPVNGADLMKQGLAQGPELGRLLFAVENWWIDQGFAPDKDACLAQLQIMMAAGR